MDSFEINKIIGAVLGTLLFVMGAGLVAEAIYHPIQNNGPGFALPEPVETAEGAVAEEVPDLGTLLASASAERGQALIAKCAGCHNFGEGQPNKTGPHLYDVVMRPEGSVPDFAYSDALAAHHAAGDVWTFENLDRFLTRPADYAPATKMTFPGLRSPQERADILAYLQTLSADPKPFPAPAPAAAEGEAAPAEGAPASDAPATEAPPAEGATTPTDPATTAPANVTEPTAPAAVTDTPTETQSETQVEGTPTTSGTPAATQPAAPAETTQAPAAPAAPATTPAPAAPATPAPAAPATDPAPTGSIGGSSVGISINAQAMPQPIAQ